MGEIFNQEALAALDEHRETEEMPRVTSPKLKLVLGAMLTIMVVLLYWCIFGISSGYFSELVILYRMR